MTAGISLEAAYGIYAAWMLSMPLEISGRPVFVPDATAHALFPELLDDEAEGQAGDPPSEAIATSDNPHPHRELARRCAYYMNQAAREIERLGVEVGALAPAVADRDILEGAGVPGGGPAESRAFERATLSIQLEHPDSASPSPAPSADAPANAPGSDDSVISPAALALAARALPPLARLSAGDDGDDITPQSGKD